MRHSRCPFLILLVIAFCAASSAVAQTTGDLEGTVADQNGAPLPGVSVELKSPQLQGTRTAVTDTAGRYRFPVLSPGVYSVTAQLSGFAKVERAGLKVSLGATTTIPITMGISVKEEIVVTSEAPAVDTSKTTIGTTASLDSIQRLPLGRNFASIASTVAGTGTDMSGNVTVYGATGLENAYIIDGVNTTGVKTGTQAKQLNNEFIQEVEVKTGGYEAEYGRVLGGTINVVTKSGGNEFRGDAFGYYDSGSLASSDSRTADRSAANQGEFFSPKRLDVGADLGGYFVKDRLWFFAAYDRVNQDQDYTRTLAVLRDAAQTKVQTANTDTYRNNLYSGKLTFRLGESNTIAASIFGDPGHVQRALRPHADLGHDRRGRRLARRPERRRIRLSPAAGTASSARSSSGRRRSATTRRSGRTRARSPASPYLEKQQAGFPTEALPGSGPIFLEDSKFQRYVYRAAGSLFLGAHEIKAGLDWEHLNSDFSESYGGTDRIRTRLTAAGALNNYQHRYFAKTPLSGANCLGLLDPSGPAAFPNCTGYTIAPTVDNNPITDNVGFFAQDSFKVLKNLTVNAGVRYEQQRLKDFTGTTLVKIDDEWSPRLGIVWDFAGNGRTKLYANYGRFYEVIPQDIQTRALGNEFIIFARNNSSTPDPVDLFLGAPIVQGGELVQNNLKGMYQDEIIGGVEVEVAKNWAIGVKGIYRALGRVVEDRCDLAVNPDIAQYFNPSSPATCALINPGPGRLARDDQGSVRHDVLPERRDGRERQPRGRGAVRLHAAAPLFPRPRSDGDAPLLEQLLPARVVPLLEARGELLGQPLADARGRPGGSEHQRRLRLPRARHERLRPAAQRPHASVQGLRLLRVPLRPDGGRERLLQHGPPVLDPRLRVGRDRLQRRLQPGGLPRAARLGGRSSRRLRGRPAPRIRPALRQRLGHAHPRRLQPPQPAGRPEPRGALQQHGRDRRERPAERHRPARLHGAEREPDERRVRLEPHVRKGHRLAEPAGAPSRRPRVLLRSRETS